MATALPAILTAILVYEFLGIARVSQRLNTLIRSMESAESLDAIIASSISEASAALADSKTRKRKAKKKSKIVEAKEKDVSFEEPIEIDDVPIELVFPEESEMARSRVVKEAPPKEVEEPRIFGDVDVPEGDFSDFELVVKKDGSFDLKTDADEEEEQ